ncbi:PaaI family thioesterase [Asticcacaulis tiandongensis]|uniref:PaaI family thioesterase n=1 Tax=Asticcacaulis tiandongensis TaxID=2565365 RepID=UPI00112A6582|nr:PaaI family thioesterase [Asticcacaulis tiandongensis]
MITLQPTITPEHLFAQIPFARFLNLELDIAGTELRTHMPFAPHLIGNPLVPALHGGVIGAFLEMTAMVQLAVAENLEQTPKPVGVSVQYLRSAKPVSTYAEAHINRVGRTIANIEARAWQDARENPVALLQAHFLIG